MKDSEQKERGSSTIQNLKKEGFKMERTGTQNDKIRISNGTIKESKWEKGEFKIGTIRD